MDDERFEEEDVRRTRSSGAIVLSDGRQITSRTFIENLLNSGLREDGMREALYRVLTTTPITIEFSDTDNVRGVDVEKFFKKKKGKDRTNYEEVRIELDGVRSDDPAFYNVLVKYGDVYEIK